MTTLVVAAAARRPGLTGVAVMSLRAAANQFGYLLGAALGGLARPAGGVRPRRPEPTA